MSQYAKRRDVKWIALLVLAALAAPLLVNAALYLERRRVVRGRCEGSESLPWPTFVRAFLLECAAWLLAIAAPVFRPLVRGAGTHERNHLVVLVAGDGLGVSAFWLLERRLKALGWDTALVTRIAAREPFDRAANELGRRILQRRERCRAELVSVLAFGCTGLLVRRWLREQPTGTIHQLLTLGTPHQGTLGLPSRFPWLRFARASSTFLHDIAESDPVPRRFDTIAISSELDAWVVPNDAAYYPGAFNIAVRDVGHFTLLLAKRVADLVTENLTTASAAQRK